MSSTAIQINLPAQYSGQVFTFQGKKCLHFGSITTLNDEAIGTPCPKVRRLRFTPLLPRSVGLGPVFSPAQRGLGHRPIQSRASPSRFHPDPHTARCQLARV